MIDSVTKTKNIAPKASKKMPEKKMTVVNKTPTKPQVNPPEVLEKKQPTVVKAKKTISKVAKPQKQKMIRDSFTMPADDYAKLSMLKAKCLENGMEVKKSELIRAGLTTLSNMPVKTLLNAVKDVERIKTGRPKAK
jgi:hypothetical protein